MLVWASYSMPGYCIDRASLVSYASSLTGKKKAELKTAIYNLCQPAYVPAYGSGTYSTWYYFYVTDRNVTTNECINRYSTNKYYFGSQGLAVSGMNIEHSFPKSWWGGAKNNAYMDLYNLYPSESSSNSSKSNYPMGKVTNPKDATAYELVGTGTAGTNGKINLFEPNDTWKGDFSRSYFYMATTYQNLTWQGTQGLQELQNDDWPTLQEWAYTLYLEWTREDQVLDIEVERNNAVYGIQGNRNLYIDFPYLAEYVWGDSIDVEFDPTTSITTAYDDNRYTTSSITKGNSNLEYSSSSSTVVLGMPFNAPYLSYAEGIEVEDITFSSSDASVATIDAYGNVTVVGLGTTTITASYAATEKYDSSSASYTLTVIEASENPVFVKVTSNDQLVSGKRYLIVYEGDGVALSTQSGNFRTSASVTIEDNTITLTKSNTSNSPYILTLGGSSGAWTFFDGTYYLSLTSDNNYLQISYTASSSKEKWTIDVDSSTGIIKNNSYPTRFINYNTSSPRFACYKTSSNQQEIALFAEVIEGATYIKDMLTSKSDDTLIYNLAGQRVKETYKGIQIRNGRKVSIR